MLNFQPIKSIPQIPPNISQRKNRKKMSNISLEGINKIGLFWFSLATITAFASTLLSLYCIFLHLKNYRRPDLQRLTIRILLMIPVYSLATIISLCSKYLSFYIDAFRDIYEAFVIYSFFILLENYLQGERAILELLSHRIRIHHLFPFNLCCSPLDMSNRSTFLFIRRGIIQFVVIKPFLALFIMILKIFGIYEEGYISWGSNYLWISLAYNFSIFLCMYCLLMFYFQCKNDLKPYRPFPKFLCVKTIIFLTFWQGLMIAFLVRIGVVKDFDSTYTANNIALALQDLLICLEMPLFAFLHMHAFPWTDYNDSRLSSRVEIRYALKDAFGIKDILQDTYYTFFKSSHVRLPSNEDIWNDEPEQETFFSTRLEFDENYDSDEELYKQSRELEFGDFNFPVVREDPRFNHPPAVLENIQKLNLEFQNRIQNESKVLLSGRPSKKYGSTDFSNSQ